MRNGLTSTASSRPHPAQPQQAPLLPPLLPFSVTPPKPAGPSEAEKKIEELTKQIEEQMEKEEESEYFGESLANDLDA
jgi:LIM domain-containing protein